MKLFRASTVLTGRPGEVIDSGEVVVDGALIKGIGARGSCLVAEDVEVIELSGCTLLPGMIDAHVHLGFDRTIDPRTRRSRESDGHLLLRMAENARKLLSAGVTIARDLGGRDFIEVELRDAIEEAWRSVPTSWSPPDRSRTPVAIAGTWAAKPTRVTPSAELDSPCPSPSKGARFRALSARISVPERPNI
jgi:hypothetical protein